MRKVLEISSDDGSIIQSVVQILSEKTSKNSDVVLISSWAWACKKGGSCGAGWELHNACPCSLWLDSKMGSPFAVLKPGSCCHVDNNPKSGGPYLQVSKKSSKQQWYWGDIRLIVRLSTRYTVHIMCMQRTWSQIQPNVCSQALSWDHGSRSQFVLECKHGATKGVCMLERNTHFYRTEELDAWCPIFSSWHCVAEHCGILKCIWPEGHADRLRPMLHCMKELLPGILGEVANCSLRNSILEVSTDPAEGELLVALLACDDKCIVCKLAIITMVVLDLHSVIGWIPVPPTDSWQSLDNV